MITYMTATSNHFIKHCNKLLILHSLTNYVESTFNFHVIHRLNGYLRFKTEEVEEEEEEEEEEVKVGFNYELCIIAV